MGLFEEEIGEVVNPTVARAKELFMQVDTFGEAVYKLDEIIAKLQQEGFTDVPQSKSTLSRWASANNWKTQRDALVQSALINQEFKTIKTQSQGEALNSIIDMATYLKKTGKINQDGLEALDRWVSGRKDRDMSDKEASVMVKIVEATGKIYEAILSKMGEKSDAKASTDEIKALIKKERGIIDIEIL